MTQSGPSWISWRYRTRSKAPASMSYFGGTSNFGVVFRRLRNELWDFHVSNASGFTLIEKLDLIHLCMYLFRYAYKLQRIQMSLGLLYQECHFKSLLMVQCSMWSSKLECAASGLSRPLWGGISKAQLTVPCLSPAQLQCRPLDLNGKFQASNLSFQALTMNSKISLSSMLLQVSICSKTKARHYDVSTPIGNKIKLLRFNMKLQGSIWGPGLRSVLSV